MKLYILLIGMILLGGALVAAQGGQIQARNESGPMHGNMTFAKNMTFGNCVSDEAILKNICYNQTKNVRVGCMSMAKSQNDSAIAKQSRAQCNQAYKATKKGCKDAFKSAKDECRKIKHNFFDSVKARFR